MDRYKGLPLSLKIWKSEKHIVKEGKALNSGSRKEKLGVNDSQTSTNGSTGSMF